MHSGSISTVLESLREEIKLIQNQECFYRRKPHHTLDEITAHCRRERRLLDIQAELNKLRTNELCHQACSLRNRRRT